MNRSPRKIQLSLKTLMVVVTAAIFALFIFWPKTKWIPIKEDDSAYNGVPTPGQKVSVFVKAPDGTINWLASGLTVVERPDWQFKDGIAMNLKLEINWYQEWKISGYKSYRIKILE